jgi:hypothetical protein
VQYGEYRPAGNAITYNTPPPPPPPAPPLCMLRNVIAAAVEVALQDVQRGRWRLAVLFCVCLWCRQESGPQQSGLPDCALCDQPVGVPHPLLTQKNVRHAHKCMVACCRPQESHLAAC